MSGLEFKHPEVLWFSLLAIVPILLHFISIKRHKKVFFTNVALLRELKKETQSVRRLRDILLMLLRVTLILTVVLMFARPYHKLIQTDTNTKVLFIDNSLSMSVSNGTVTLFDEAKRKAINFLKSLSFDEKVILSNGSNSISVERLYYRDEAIAAIKQMQLSEEHFEFNDVINRVKEINNKGVDLLVYSDFQNSSFRQEDFKVDSLINFSLFAEESIVPCNWSIDSIWVAQETVTVGEEIELRYILSGNCDDQDKVELSVFNSNQLVSISEHYTNQGREGSFKMVLPEKQVYQLDLIISDVHVEFDNRFHFVIDLEDKGSLLNISSNSLETERLKNLIGENLVKGVASTVMTFEDLKGKTIVLSPLSAVNELNKQSILDFVSRGGKLVLYPKVESDSRNLQYIDEFVVFEKDTSRVELDLTTVELIQRVFAKRSSNAKNDREIYNKRLFRIRNNWNEGVNNVANSIFYSKDSGEGIIYLFTVAEDELKNSMIWPLFLLSISEDSGISDQLYLRKGKGRKIKLASNPEIIRYKDSTNFRPVSRNINIDQPFFTSGFFGVEYDRISTAFTAVNLNHKESEIKSLDLSKVEYHKNVFVFNEQNIISESELSPSSIERYLLFVALSLIVVEMLYFTLKK